MTRVEAEDKAETLNRHRTHKREKRYFQASLRDGSWCVTSTKDRKTIVWPV